MEQHNIRSQFSQKIRSIIASLAVKKTTEITYYHEYEKAAITDTIQLSAHATNEINSSLRHQLKPSCIEKTPHDEINFEKDNY